MCAYCNIGEVNFKVMIKLFFVLAALQSSDHALLMGLAGIVCGALLIYAILSQL